MKKWTGYGWYVTVAAGLFGAVLSASFAQFSISMNELAEKTGISGDLLASSESVKTFFIIVAMLASGYVYGKLGYKKLLILSGACYILPQFIIPFNMSGAVLLLLKALQGMASLIFPVGIVIIIGWIKSSSTGLATAMYNGLFYGGGIIGGAVAGFAIPRFGMAFSYFILGGLGIGLVLLCLLTVDEKEKETSSGEKKESVKADVGQVLKNPSIWLLISGFVGTTWLVQVLATDIPLYAYDLNYSSAQAGGLVSIVSIGTVCACLVSGPVSDVFARKLRNKGFARIAALMCGYVMAAVILVLFLFLDKTNFILFQILVFLLAFSAAWGLGVFYSIIPEVFQPEQLSFVSGFAGGVADIGMPLGPLVTGVFFGLRGFWEAGFGVCLGIILMSMFSLLILSGKMRKKKV